MSLTMVAWSERVNSFILNRVWFGTHSTPSGLLHRILLKWVNYSDSESLENTCTWLRSHGDNPLASESCTNCNHSLQLFGEKFNSCKVLKPVLIGQNFNVDLLRLELSILTHPNVSGRNENDAFSHLAVLNVAHN